MKKLIIASTSTVHGKPYLTYILPELAVFFKGVKELLFIPYARPSGLTHDAYTKKAKEAFGKIGITVKGIHEFDNPAAAVSRAAGIFTGGGNTFVLLKELYQHQLIAPLQVAITSGTPYFGTSAGSNITGLSVQNTNDMPIVYPPSFKALEFINFNINPHYLDPDLNSTHMGETRETRINEYHTYHKTPVLGLREGSWLQVNGDTVVLKGRLQARLFEQGKKPVELPTGTVVSEQLINNS